AELTPEQIDGFLPRWCRANVRRDSYPAAGGEEEREERIAREAELMAQRLSKAVHAHPGVARLAENPLLLTLLAVMQQNSIELPRQRAELYKAVTSTLLENRNIAKQLVPIPEAQAIQRLGPIAYEMQKSGNNFARQKDVRESLTHTIEQEGGTPQEVAQEVENFLLRIRERGGLFVIRTGDYFGFFHRTFQEYFAARYILNQIKRDPDPWIATLVELARSRHDLWREPFLLAVAYQSSEDEIIARKIIQVLLDVPQGADFKAQAHDLLLAAECVVEAKPLTIGSTLEKQIARQLVQAYEQALRIRDFEVNNDIESMMSLWLLSLPEEVYRPVPVIVLSEVVSDSQDRALQRVALTLLANIAQRLVDGAPAIFELLVPPLLALSGQPAVGEFHPADGLPESSDFNIIDLALAALSFMRKRGPAGALLGDVRQHFKERPEHLSQLARYSLECGTLITPTLVPLSDDNYQHYEAAIARWIELRDSYRLARITERDVSACLEIHEQLLFCAEEASYPTAMHLLKMLQIAGDNPSLPWQQNWQQYMLEQMDSGHYTSYQELALLWTMLFPNEKALAPLAQHILEHYNGSANSVQRYAQRFITSLGFDLRYLRDLRDLNSLRDLSFLRNLIFLRYLRDLRDLSFLRNLRDLSSLRYLNSLRDLQNTLLTQKVAEKAQSLIPAKDETQTADLLLILLGRVLEIQEEEKTGQDIESEVKQIVQVALDSIASASSEEVCEAALDIIRYMPVRTANEVEFVLQLTEKVADERVQRACVEAIRFARLNAEGKAALETRKQSGVKMLREAVERRLRQKG
ncbi:MAG TPA: hypothetical protein VFB60_22175, partial [Ktedonobacteraceae bacterium]|nr:hypothetical protein [Ktedonobacteraceae bacterium]